MFWIEPKITHTREWDKQHDIKMSNFKNMRFIWLVMCQFVKIHRMKGETENCSKKGQQVFPEGHAYLSEWLQTRMVRNLGLWA